MKNDLGVGEQVFLKKKRVRNFEVGVRGRSCIEKFDRATGAFKERTPWTLNTMHADGIDEFLALIVGTSSKHLDATNTYLAIGNADPLVAFTLKLNPPDAGPTGGTNTKSAPRYTMLWQFNDDTATVRTNMNYAELWYKDPEGGTDEYKVNSLNVAQGTKPADENWHWLMEIELYSTDTDLTSDGMNRLMDLIGGNASLHADATETWFRPYTSADAGLGSTGQQPDGAPTVNTSLNTITWVWTVADGTYNGAWDKTMITLSSTTATYTSTTTDRLRYGTCTTAGAGCGTKASGEVWEYTYVLTLAQGS